MKKVIYVLSAALLLPWAPLSADAQEESVLQHVAEVHVKPGGAERFETAAGERNDRITAAGVSFLIRTAVSESLVYRFVTPVADYEGLARRNSEMSQVAAPAAGEVDVNDAVDHVDTYLRWTRPDLGYRPADPRLEVSEWQAVQRQRFYVQMGKMDEVVDVLRDVRDLYARHDVAESYGVSMGGIGADGPMVEVQLWASSMADIYETGSRLEEVLGSEMNQIRRRMGALVRRIEVDNLAIRRDLGYQPAN